MVDIKENRDDELANCNFIKTILMLLVVFYHCILYWGGEWFDKQPATTSNVLSILASWLNSFHIYAFVLVSGYIFFYSRYECGKYGKFTPFVANKAKRLLIPYVFVALVWAIPFQCVFFKTDIIEILRRYVLGTSPSQLWFLLMLFVLFTIVYPLSDFFEKHNLFGCLVVCAFYGVGLVGQKFLPNIFQVFTACTYAPLFYLGFKMRQYKNGWIKKIPWWTWILLDVLLFAVSFYIKGQNGAIYTIIGVACNFILHLIGAVMAFVCLGKIANLVKWGNSKAFKSLSKITMPIYLFHQQVIYISIYTLNGLINPYVHALLNMVVSMAVSIGISIILMKFKHTRMLIGEK